MRYRITTDGLTYPVGESLTRAQAAGGLSKLTAAERATLTMKQVDRGAVVNDVPETSVPWLLEQGQIEPVADGRRRVAAEAEE